MQSMAEFWRQQAEWSRATFGADDERGPTGPAKHLAKEVLCELLNADRDSVSMLLDAVREGDGIRDVEEWVDALFLVFDGSRRAGFGYDHLLAAAWDKLAKNKARRWNIPVDGQPVEHERD